MATLVCFHAHPDDECIATGGLMALASDAGHRVVLVTATRGEQGEPVDGVLADGEALWERRVDETHASGRILGAQRVVFLGYEDSGMMGEDTNDAPGCFWRADEEEAVGRLAAILDEEGCDVLTVYDDHGGYGHPDHIQVHRVGVAAARRAEVPVVLEATMNRDEMRRLMARRDELAADVLEGLEESVEEESGAALDDAADAVEAEDFGTPEEHITHGLDVSSVLDRKREAMEAHASQIAPDSFFLAMPPKVFAAAFGTEWFIHRGHPRAEGESMRSDVLGLLGG